MGRSIYQQPCRNIYHTWAAVQNVLTVEGYKYICKNNEYIWQKGNGFLTASKYIKVEFTPQNIVIVSAWISVCGIETEIDDSFVGLIPKESVKGTLSNLFRAIL